MGVGVAVTSRKGFLGDFSSKLGIFLQPTSHLGHVGCTRSAGACFRAEKWGTWIQPVVAGRTSKHQAGFRGQGKRIILVIISAPLPAIVTNVCKGVRKVKKNHSTSNHITITVMNHDSLLQTTWRKHFQESENNSHYHTGDPNERQNNECCRSKIGSHPDQCLE